MGGIAGVLSPDRQDLIYHMLDKIKHRGTGAANVWNGPYAALGSTGLASLNEEPGPVLTPSGMRAGVCDGRLYNRDRLLGELEFHTLENNSDAEVALHFYEERGTRAIGRLEGEFALAFVEGERLLLARDRLGIRPLYYGFSEGALCFASEIKALVGIVDQVHEFPPGNFLSTDWGLFPYQPYFPKATQLDGALESAEQLVGYLRRAVRDMIPPGIEVGVWLSGGVDSSVVAVLARPMVERLHAFSAGMAGAPDLVYARQVAEHIGARYYERIYELDDMLAVLEKVIYHLESFDAPLVRSAISNYLVAELAGQHVPFVLSGEGGDELFAGYAYQKDCNSEAELTLSVQEAIAALHNTALQRVDRSAAAHHTRAGMPFLHPEVVRYALSIPAHWKIRGRQSMEKWPLRRGLAGELPEEIIWRGKVKFWQGVGSAELLAEYAGQEISDQEFARECDQGDGLQLRSKEELLYYRIFKNHFGSSLSLAEIGRTQYE